MIVLKNITIKFQDICILQDISLRVDTASIHCIVGDSGAGKSMLLNTIMGNLPENINSSGELICPASFLVPQDINEVFNPTKTVLAHLAKSSKTKIEYYLKDLQLNLALKDLNRYPCTFSQGQLQQISILMILLQDIKVILMDEPTAFLDESSKKNLQSLILKLQQLGYTFVVTTHDTNWGAKIASSVHILKNRQLKLYTLEQGSKLALDNFTLLQEVIDKSELIFKTDVGKLNYNKKLIIQNLSFNLYQGDSLVIMGHSGIGKTSLIKALTRQNEFKVTGEYNRKYKINYISQNYSGSLTPHLSVKANLLDVAKGFKKQHLYAHYRILLRLFYKLQLPTFLLKHYPNQLSLGEKQRVILLRHLLRYILKNSQYQILALDEITSSLSKEHQDCVIDILKDFRHKYNITYILVTHNYHLANAMANKVLHLNDTGTKFYTRKI